MELNITIFLQIFIFVMLLLWLSKSLFKPIMRLFEERERRIEGAQQEAASFNSLAEEKWKTFEIQYAQAKENARQALSELKHQMEKENSELLEVAKASARERLVTAEKALLKEEQQIKEQLQKSSEEIASYMVNSLMQRSA